MHIKNIYMYSIFKKYMYIHGKMINLKVILTLMM